MKEDLVPWIPVALGGLLALASLLGALAARRRERLLEDLPTSKVQGVFIGLVELKGTAESRRPLTSYLAESPCVYYTWSVEEHWERQVEVTTRDSDGHERRETRTESGWTTVGQGGEMIPFVLRDDTGAVRVDPEGAKVEPVVALDETCGRGDPLYYGKGPAGSISDSTHRRRFREEALPVGAALYVVGHAREREDVVAPEIAYEKNAAMFLISMRSEKQVESGMAWQWWLLGILGLVLSVAGVLVRAILVAKEARGRLEMPVAEFVLAGGLYLVAWIVGWVWMAYNSLVGLRQRVRQAWSLIEVELKRRSDLIPGLVAAVQGYRDYESRVQKEVAALRAQAGATAPGQPGPDPQALLPELRVIQERYPDLKAQPAFLKLQESLVETEQRIALARSYFNDVATFYNTRLEEFPDRFLAGLGAMTPQPLMAAADFERAPVTVEFESGAKPIKSGA